MNFVQIAQLIGCHGNIKGKFSIKYSKIFPSEIVRGMKLKLCIHVHDISLYINCVFIVVAHVLSLPWQLISFHRLQMGKVEIGIYFCVTADILTKVLQKCSWSSPLQTIWILSKLLVLIGWQPKCLIFEKNIQNLLLRSHKRDEAETLHKCLCYYPLHKLYFFYCCCACGFVAMATWISIDL